MKKLILIPLLILFISQFELVDGYISNGYIDYFSREVVLEYTTGGNVYIIAGGEKDQIGDIKKGVKLGNQVIFTY